MRIASVPTGRDGPYRRVKRGEFGRLRLEPSPPGLVSGVLPPARYALVPGGSVSTFLAANGTGATAREAGAADTFGAAPPPVLADGAAITRGG